VPELFAGSGATAIGSQHAQYPWTMGLLPAFAGEGAVYGRQIAAHQANAKIAVLYENDEYGAELLAGLEGGSAGTRGRSSRRSRTCPPTRRSPAR
jgi:branched-chain amino acid transport system substrate-binding protein